MNWNFINTRILLAGGFTLWLATTAMAQPHGAWSPPPLPAPPASASPYPGSDQQPVRLPPVEDDFRPGHSSAPRVTSLPEILPLPPMSQVPATRIAPSDSSVPPAVAPLRTRPIGGAGGATSYVLPPLPEDQAVPDYASLDYDTQHPVKPETDMPASFVPWWQPATTRPLRNPTEGMAVDANSLVVDALRYSAQVRAISDNALITQASITRAAAEFDVHTFMESKFIRTSIPTGSTLEAGFNVPRLREEDGYIRAGVRKKNSLGGSFEVSQQAGLRDSNSQFFFPGQQANSRLTLGYNQPLLNGAGKAYNNSLVVLANIDTRVAANRTAAELQDHLLEVTEAMWELYQQRTVLLQKQRHLERAQVIYERLAQRRGIDSLESQVLRARAAVSLRRAELIRAGTAIRNAEARVRALVNSPDMLSNRQTELVPVEPPIHNFIPVSMDEAIYLALENRPEINTATKEIQAARVRLNVAENELMPVLDLVLETYVSGLRGQYNVGRSWADQFAVGEPSYTAGLVFEVPYQRRAAKANFQRRQIELRQLSSRLQVAIETLHADVEVAVREVETAYREMQARYVSMAAADSDVCYLQRRWEELPGDDRAASFLLADLLDAQDRLVLEEFGFSRSHVDYTLSLTRLKRATGTLLQYEEIELVKTEADCLPVIEFQKAFAAPPTAGP
ncbi:TolC family protein [Lignipirellula cremea]|uniref:Outer membrane efflux protein n=1 Tax=Lignipirellula cremea TaxID=2528010 RepID=A0A518E4M0_9BACT|nr:TolC family protein [Lignipirellula cremea]QDU99018.1 Outer membrane efflux protein [Lignipirellula cremea]